MGAGAGKKKAGAFRAPAVRFTWLEVICARPRPEVGGLLPGVRHVRVSLFFLPQPPLPR